MSTSHPDAPEPSRLDTPDPGHPDTPRPGHLDTPEPSHPDAGEPSRRRLSVDWAAVLIAAVLVLLVGFGLVPAVPW